MFIEVIKFQHGRWQVPEPGWEDLLESMKKISYRDRDVKHYCKVSSQATNVHRYTTSNVTLCYITKLKFSRRDVKEIYYVDSLSIDNSFFDD